MSVILNLRTPQRIATRYGTSFLLSLVVLTLLWLLFFWKLWTPTPGDRVIFAQDGDFTLHYYGPISQNIEQFRQTGTLALWTPYNRAGMPLLANIQNSVFYPPRYLVAAAAGINGFTIETFQWESALHVWLTSVAMYAFLLVVIRSTVMGAAERRIIPIALFGAILWAYGGYITGYPILQINIMETAAWLPLALLGAHLTVSGMRRWLWGMALVAISVTLMLLAGHPQVAMYCIYLVVLYGLFNGWAFGKVGLLKTVIRIGAACALGFMLAAVQLLPTLEFFRLSYRAVDQTFTDKALGFDIAGLTGLIWPSADGAWSPLYFGAAGIILAIWAVIGPRVRRVDISRKYALFWAGISLVALLMSLGDGTILYDLFYVFVPGFSFFRNQERIVVLVAFALVMLAVYGLDRALRVMSGDDDTGTSDSNRARKRSELLRLAGMYATLLVGVFAVIFIAVRLGLSDQSGFNAQNGFSALMAVGFAGWATWATRKPRGQEISSAQTNPLPIAVLIALVVVDLFTIGTRSANYLPDLPENRIQLDAPLTAYITAPQDIQWRVDGGAGLQGGGDYFRIPDIYGVGPFALESMERLYTLPVDRLWEVLAVRYITTSDEPPDTLPLELLAYGVNRVGQEYKLFESQNPRPMAYLVYDYREASNSAEFARQIMADTRVNLREMAVTLSPLPFELPIERPDISTVEDFRWVSAERAEMTVSTEANGLLTIAVANYPGWQAEIDGQPAEIVDTYAGLIGIPVQAGENQQVTLTFAPDSLRLGLLISAIGGLLVGLLVAMGVIVNRR